MKKIIRLGSRGSPLALIQASEVRERLLVAHSDMDTEYDIEIVPIRTTGDWSPQQSESRFIDMGGNKGLFTKEIEEMLSSGQIDMAVHSMKDVAGHLPDGLEVAALLERLDPRDAFIGRNVRTLDELPPGASIGTSSLRRQAQILAHRPDLRVVPLRGNVDTRLNKLADGMADATLLAVAGLTRLNAIEKISSILPPTIMLPAAAQGAIGIEIRRGDELLQKLIAPLNSPTASACIGAERAVLKVLDGSCQTPIAALANLAGDTLKLDALVARPDGTEIIRRSKEGRAQDFLAIGTELGRELKDSIPAGFFGD